MFVRWKRRPRKQLGWHHNHVVPVLLTATLVESRRIDGKPRQRTIAYVGSIRDRQVPDAECRDGFWEDAEPRLAALGLPQSERAKIEAALEEVVPRLPAEQSTARRAKRRQTRAVVEALEAARAARRAPGRRVRLSPYEVSQIRAAARAEIDNRTD